MTRPPWSFTGGYKTATVTQGGNSLTAVVPNANATSTGYIWVNPVSATRKYTFSFNVLCTTTDKVNVLGVSAKVYYEDPGSGETILLWESNPSNKYWMDNGNKTVERTVVFPESFESETGRFMYSITNSGTGATACISVYNVKITDMTTADLDNSLDNFGDRLEGAGSDKPALDTDISVFQSSIDTMNGWLEQLDGFADTIDEAGQTANEYISKGTEMFNGFMGVAPTAVIALVGFGIVFVVVRKIVGR